MSGDTDSTADAVTPTPARFRLGPWEVKPETGELSDGETTTTLEPKLMALLSLLVSRSGSVLSREQIEQALWPNAVVGEDTVARAVSRLRRSLGDSARSPRFIETLSKRGYRLIASVERLATTQRQSAVTVMPAGKGPWRLLATALLAAVVVAGAWLALQPPDSLESDPSLDALAAQVARADDLYMRFTRADNEAAIGLYERVLAEQPENASAQAGLANSLVQRVVRWPRSTDAEGVTTLTEALDRGLTSRPEAKAVLARASAMAERAVQLAPRDPDALKALAFTYAAQGDLDRAAVMYNDVIALDADAWAAMVNLGEIYSMRGDKSAAVGLFERAFEAMERAYDYEPQRVGAWQVPFGVMIGQMHEELSHPADAELWYRRVLGLVPYEPEATVRLARLLAASGQSQEAMSLCQALIARIGDARDCPR